jgi:hypothetical protein
LKVNNRIKLNFSGSDIFYTGSRHDASTKLTNDVPIIRMQNDCLPKVTFLRKEILVLKYCSLRDASYVSLVLLYSFLIFYCPKRNSDVSTQYHSTSAPYPVIRLSPTVCNRDKWTASLNKAHFVEPEGSLLYPQRCHCSLC